MLLHFMMLAFVGAQHQAGSCSTNPFLQQFQQFVMQLNNQDIGVLQQMNKYEYGEPVAQSSLKYCTQFAGSSCCTVDFELALSNITQIYFQTRQEQSFPFTTIMKSLETSIQNCAVRDPTTFKLIEQAPIPGLQDAILQYRQNVAQLLLENSKFIRGNLCVMCSPPSQFTTFIKIQGSNQQVVLLVDAGQYQNYLTDITATFQSLQAQIPIFKDLLESYFTQYADSAKCSSILIKLSSYMDGLQFCVGGDCTAYLKQRINVFIQEMDEELIYFQQPDFGYATAQVSTTNSRLLSQVDSFILQGTNGLITYIADPNIDAKIQYQGMRLAMTTTVFAQMIAINMLIYFHIQI